jgi:hypothetical protein
MATPFIPYLLRIRDPKLWKKARTQAALEGLTMNGLIHRLLRDWLEPARKHSSRKQ